jgi:hypothetical protein
VLTGDRWAIARSVLKEAGLVVEVGQDEIAQFGDGADAIGLGEVKEGWRKEAIEREGQMGG